MRRVRSAILAMLVAAPGRAAAAACSLEDCFRSAVRRSETLTSDAESIRRAEEDILQSRANFHPSADLSATYTRQDEPGGALGQSLFPSTQKTAQISVTQTLFRGFRAIATLRQSKAAKEASIYAWQKAYIQLYEDTAQSYFNVLKGEHDLRNYDLELKSHRARREQLARMRNFGRAREADVVAVEASIAGVEASAASARGVLGSDRATLAFLTGVDGDLPIVDIASAPVRPSEGGIFLTRLDQRPDVKEAGKTLEAAGYAVTAARGAYFPSVAATGNYYLTRPGAYSDVKWDAQLSLSLPLFSGGKLRSDTRKAESSRETERLAYARVSRQATEEIRSLFNVAEAGSEQAAKLTEASKLYDRYYDLLLKDNQAGIASNVDVMLALATVEQTRRSLDRAVLSAHYDAFRLRLASADPELFAQVPGGPDAAR